VFNAMIKFSLWSLIIYNDTNTHGFNWFLILVSFKDDLTFEFINGEYSPWESFTCYWANCYSTLLKWRIRQNTMIMATIWLVVLENGHLSSGNIFLNNSYFNYNHRWGSQIQMIYTLIFESMTSSRTDMFYICYMCLIKFSHIFSMLMLLIDWANIMEISLI